MYKSVLKTGLAFFMIMMLTATGTLLAQPRISDSIKPGEIYPRDKFVFAQVFSNEGVIKGDLFYWAQNVTSTGTVTGDIIGGGQDVNLSGKVQGNVRTAGKSVTLSSAVGKNVIACGADVTINSAIDGSLMIFGRDITINGKIKGDTRIYGHNIKLQGEFFGDVIINDLINDRRYKHESRHRHARRYKEARDSKASLIVLPGAVIHGKLRFTGTNADIQKGAKADNFKWTKSAITPEEKSTQEVKKYIWKFMKMLFTTLVLFLIGLLLYKLYPTIITRMGEFSVKKPGNAIVYGIAAVFSTIPAFVIFIILLALSFIMTPAFGLIFGLSATGIYIVLFYFSTIPVGLWIGNLILKNKPNVYLRLGLGLILFNVVIFILNFLKDLHIAGSLFPALAFIVKFAAIMFGAGALLFAVKELHAAARQG